MSNLTSLTNELCSVSGISGREHAVSELILKKISPHCTASVDAMGNIIAYKKGIKPAEKTVLFAAHMDEVGFMITNITDEGLLKFTIVGGIDSRYLLGKAVEVEGGVIGIIGRKAVHMQSQSEKTTPPDADDLYIDIGAITKEDAQKAVSVGDSAVFLNEFREFGDNKIKSRALDDRVGCALLIDMIVSEDLEYDTVFAFTVQEENGCRGAKTAAFAVKPDIVAAVETTTAKDIPSMSDEKRVCRLGKGPVLSIMDFTTVYDKTLFNKSLNAAQKAEIPVQIKNVVSGGNDSGSLQRSANGAKAAAVSVPCRYLHTPNCMIDKDDVANTQKLLREMITAFNDGRGLN